MQEIAVKTLDGRTHNFSVPNEMTVAEFKNHISEPLNIPAERQRVIFQGRLLNNESRLGELNLNGRAVHVVERTPPTHPPEGQGSEPEPHVHRQRPDFIMAAGSFEVPPDIQQVVQQAVNQFGPAARGASVETRRMPGGGPGLEVHIRLPPPGQAAAGTTPQERAAHEVNERIRIANKMLNLASHVVNSVESNAEASSSNTPSDNAATSGAATHSPQVPPDPEVGLAAAISNISSFNDRLKPLLEEFNNTVLHRREHQDEASRQRAIRLAQAIPEAFHHVSHALHNLSDLAIDPNHQTTATAAENPPAPNSTETSTASQSAQAHSRFAVSSSTVTPVQGVGVYQQVFSVPVLEIQHHGPNAQPQNQGQNQPPGNQQPHPGPNPFVFAPRIPGQMFNPFNLGGIFPRPPVAAVITNGARPQGAQQPQNQPGTEGAPGPAGVGPNMVRPIDQNLPCLSRHFLAPHVVEAARLSSQNANAAQQNQQNQQQQQQQQPPTANTGNQPGVDPANMMNMFQDITNFVMQAIVQAGSHQQPNQGNRQQQQQPLNQGLPANFMASMQQLAGNVPTNEPFGQIINSLGQLFADPSGSATRTSAYDFIQGLGNVPPMTPSPVNNLIEVIMRALPMADFISLIMGDTTPLARVHAPLREYFATLMGPNNQNGVAAVVDPLITELRSMYDFVFTDIQTRDNIDLVATLVAHDRSWITRVVQMVNDTPPSVGPVEANNASFYRRLYDIVLNAAHESVVLVVHAIGQENARPTMRRLVQRAIANMEPGSPESQSTFVVSAMSDFANRLVTESPQRIPLSQVEPFIVRRQTQTQAPAQAPPPYTPATPQSSTSSSSTEPRLAASSAPVGSPNVNATWVQKDAQARSRASVLMTNPVTTGASNGNAGEDWRAVVPADWIPVIEQDIAKQRASQGVHQPPFSDAYISGLPAKRRRMAMEQRANDSLANNTLARGYQEILGNAVRQAGVPQALAPALLEEASSSTELESLFETEVIRQIRSRLATDPNFDPSRYPEIARFFENRPADK